MGMTAHKLPDEKFTLWVDSLDYVTIKHNTSGDEVQIPSDALKMIVASAIRDKKIGELEQMEDDEILNL
jgi:hypothetical protein